MRLQLPTSADNVTLFAVDAALCSMQQSIDGTDRAGQTLYRYIDPPACCVSSVNKQQEVTHSLSVGSWRGCFDSRPAGLTDFRRRL